MTNISSIGEIKPPVFERPAFDSSPIAKGQLGENILWAARNVRSANPEDVPRMMAEQLKHYRSDIERIYGDASGEFIDQAISSAAGEHVGNWGGAVGAALASMFSDIARGNLETAEAYGKSYKVSSQVAHALSAIPRLDPENKTGPDIHTRMAVASALGFSRALIERAGDALPDSFKGLLEDHLAASTQAAREQFHLYGFKSKSELDSMIDYYRNELLSGYARDVQFNSNFLDVAV